jgi:hypothetical protein
MIRALWSQIKRRWGAMAQKISPSPANTLTVETPSNQMAPVYCPVPSDLTHLNEGGMLLPRLTENNNAAL